MYCLKLFFTSLKFLLKKKIISNQKKYKLSIIYWLQIFFSWRKQKHQLIRRHVPQLDSYYQYCFLKNNFIYVFIDCAGSLLMPRFFQLRRARATLQLGCVSAQQLWFPGSRAQAQQLWRVGLQLLHGRWGVSRPGFEPVFPALAGRFFSHQRNPVVAQLLSCVQLFETPWKTSAISII